MRDQQGVEHPTVVGGGEHARDDHDLPVDGDLRDPRGPWPVERFGDRAQRNPEATHGRLREHDEVGSVACSLCRGVGNDDEIRARIIGAFERAELTDDPAERERLLTFVVVGAGPTGVELAGQLAELANRTLASSYRSYNPHAARVVLLDGAPQVLPPFGKRLGRKAQKSLEKMGVIVKLGAMVTDVNEEGVTYKNMKDETEEFIPSFCKIWSAGVSASPLGKMIAEQTGAETDRAGRVVVNEDMTAGDCKNVYVVGDMSNRENLPGVAQVAIQGGEYVAENIAAEADGRDVAERQPFEYFDKGSMATVSRFSAVAKMGKVEVSGFIGWVLWLAVHLMFLVGFRNRLVSCVSWGLNVLDRNRWQMVSTRQQMYARNAINRLAELNKDKAEQDLPLEVRDTRREHRANKNK